MSIHTCLPGMECIARPPGSETRAWGEGAEMRFNSSLRVRQKPVTSHMISTYLRAWVHEQGVSSHAGFSCSPAEAGW